jgi:hypothetical protein
VVLDPSISAPVGQHELSQLASGMIVYVRERANLLCQNEERLSAESLGCRIGIFDLARR